MDSGSPKTNPAGIVGNIRKLYAYIIVVCVTLFMVISDVDYKEYLNIKNDIELIWHIKETWDPEWLDRECGDMLREEACKGVIDEISDEASECNPFEKFYCISYVTQDSVAQNEYVRCDHPWTLVSVNNNFDYCECIPYAENENLSAYRCQLSIACIETLADFRTLWDELENIEILLGTIETSGANCNHVDILFDYDVRSNCLIAECKETPQDYVDIEFLPAYNSPVIDQGEGYSPYLTLGDIINSQEKQLQYAFHDPVSLERPCNLMFPRYLIEVSGDQIITQHKNLQLKIVQIYLGEVFWGIEWEEGEYERVFAGLNRNLASCENEELDYIRDKLESLCSSKLSTLDFFGIRIGTSSIAFTGVIVLVLLSFLLLVEFEQLAKSLDLRTDIRNIAWFPFYYQKLTSILHGVAFCLPPLVILFIILGVNKIYFNVNNIIANSLMLIIAAWIAYRQIILDGIIKARIQQIRECQKYYNSQ